MRIIRTGSRPRKRSKLEERLQKALEACPPPGILAFTEEHKFHPTRKWLFDFAWPAVKVAIEVQGGGFRRGKHTRGAGQQNDFEKLNEAQRLGWVVLQFGPAQLSSHRKCRKVVSYVAQILKDRLDAQANKNHQPEVPDYRYVSTSPYIPLVDRGPRPPRVVRRSR